jgi:hypothetical protein
LDNHGAVYQSEFSRLIRIPCKRILVSCLIDLFNVENAEKNRQNRQD